MSPVMDHYFSLLLYDEAIVSDAAKMTLRRFMKAGCGGSKAVPNLPGNSR